MLLGVTAPCAGIARTAAIWLGDKESSVAIR
jgi:hypothetical protein